MLSLEVHNDLSTECEIIRLVDFGRFCWFSSGGNMTIGGGLLLVYYGVNEKTQV